MALDACYTGSWYDTQRDGEGINIEVLEELTVAYFYTFDKNDNQAWFTLLGDKILTMHQTVIPAMAEVRTWADTLELLVDDGDWPLPTYREMLFIR